MKLLMLGMSLGMGLIAPPSWAQSHMPTNPQALDVIDVFSHACLANGAKPERVRAYALEQHYQEVTNAAALQVFSGDGPGGSVWIVPGLSTTVALAIRSQTQGCAVFGEHADPGDIATMYEVFLKAITPQGGEAARLPDRQEASAFGAHIGKEAIIHAPDGRVATLTMITNERPGSTYQATLQITSLTAPR